MMKHKITTARYLELHLLLRAIIADKEQLTATCNYELAKYGEWQCDWYTAYAELNTKQQAILDELENYAELETHDA